MSTMRKAKLKSRHFYNTWFLLSYKQFKVYGSKKCLGKQLLKIEGELQPKG